MVLRHLHVEEASVLLSFSVFHFLEQVQDVRGFRVLLYVLGALAHDAKSGDPGLFEVVDVAGVVYTYLFVQVEELIVDISSFFFLG